MVLKYILAEWLEAELNEVAGLRSEFKVGVTSDNFDLHT